ncbi:MAG: hypothetical protein CVU06_00800 [Bacteroidetes bacterium HGW-Bacteroidetes-22]|nr:MAG: hypothetical protein CVU06_00800 [Bacteroidetes bacterium HGW-Bacteroidetes-22]
MKKSYLFIKMLVVAITAFGFSVANLPAQVITLWDFDLENLTPTTGTGTAALIGGTTSTWAGGLPSTGRGWNTSTYPAQGTAAGTAGTQFNVSTVGWNQVIISWDQRHSNTSANRIRLQYTLNGTTWIDFVASDANATNINTTTTVTAGFDNGRYIADDGDKWFNRSANLGSITGANNNASFAFRIVSEFFDGANYGPAKTTGTYGVSGTWRFDNVTVNGTPAGPGLPEVTTSAVTNITYNSATGGGNVTSNGGAAITGRGVCWGTSPSPTITGAHTTEAGTTGTFTSQMTNLEYNTQYYVRAYATNAQGTGYGLDVTFTTTVPPFAPVVDFEASNLEIVVGQSVDFTDLSTNVPTSWNWSFNGANPMTSTEQNPQNIQYNFAGLYTVCLTATNAYGSDTDCKEAYINVVEQVDAQIVITEIMYNPPESGTDSLEYIELYNNGATAVNMENFYMSSGVEFTFPAVTINSGEYLLIAVNAQAMQNTFGKTSYQWTSGALSNSGEAIALKDNFGVLVDSLFYDDVMPWDTLADGFGYSLVLCDPDLDNSLGENWGHDTTLIAINAGGDSIWGNPGTGCPQAGDPPVADFEGTPTTITQGSSVQFTDLSTGNPSTYLWTFEGGTPSTWNTAVPPVITYNSAGVFDVTLVVTNEWGISTELKSDYIDVLVGIDGRESRGFNVYPNPSNGVFNVDLKSDATLRVYTLLGDVLTVITTDNDSFKLNMSRFEKGMYLLEVEYADGSKHTQRLVVR